jgi:hypothetical protein
MPVTAAENLAWSCCSASLQNHLAAIGLTVQPAIRISHDARKFEDPSAGGVSAVVSNTDQGYA